MAVVEERGTRLGVAPTCAALGVARATFYRHRRRLSGALAVNGGHPAKRCRPVSATRYCRRCTTSSSSICRRPRSGVTARRRPGASCSIRTMYRVLPRTTKSASGATSCATRPTKRRNCWRPGPIRSGAGTSPSSWARRSGPNFYLYVMLDIFSRYVVGWLLARGESAALAKAVIEQSCQRQHVAADQLIIHADRGSAMTSTPVALLLATPGRTALAFPAARLRRQPVLGSPVQDAQVPARFPVRSRLLRSFEDAEAFCRRFFPGTTPSIATSASA
jgi:putative transposase